MQLSISIFLDYWIEGEILINAKYDEEFIFNDGARAKNLLELLIKIEQMSSTEFHYFVNSSKNDFANWIGTVLNDKIFADQLRYVMTKEDTTRLIRSRINNLSTEIIHSRQKSYDSLNDAKNDSKVVSHNAINILGSSAIRISSGSNNIPNTLPETSQTENNNRSNNFDIEKNLSRNYSNSDNSKGLKASRNWFKLLRFNKVPNSELVHTSDYADSSKLKNNLKERENIDYVTKNKICTNSNNEKNVVDNNIQVSDNASSRKYYSNIYAKYLSAKRFLNKKPHNSDNDSISKKDHHTHINSDEERENALWLVTYVVLVVLIVSLLIYKLFLS